MISTLRYILFLMLYPCLIHFCLSQKQQDDETWTPNPEVELPKAMIICYRDMPTQERNECIKNSMKSLLPAMKNGIPSLGVPDFDPYKIKKTVIEFNTGQISSKSVMKNALISGFSRAQVKNVRTKINDRKMYIEIDMKIPELTTEAQYKGSGGFNELRVNSTGWMKVTLNKMSGTWKFLGEIENIQGEDYMIFKKFDIDNLAIKNMQINATGLFPDPDVNSLVLEFINQYWESLYKQVLPQMKSVWEPITLGSVNKFFGHVPFRRLLPKQETKPKSESDVLKKVK
uniref:CSON001101 protein n=1 Tax=Culicoides sonorensis TaxID=179676 RepID=A0A336MFV3_CULSO